MSQSDQEAATILDAVLRFLNCSIASSVGFMQQRMPGREQRCANAPLASAYAGTMAFQLLLRHAGQQIKATTTLHHASPIFKDAELFERDLRWLHDGQRTRAAADLHQCFARPREYWIVWSPVSLASC